MKLSRNSNNLGGGTIGDLLKRIKPEAVEEKQPQKQAESPQPEKKAELPKPAADQSLTRHRVSGAHHNSGAMGSTGWQDTSDSMLDQMLKRLSRDHSNYE